MSTSDEISTLLTSGDPVLRQAAKGGRQPPFMPFMASNAENVTSTVGTTTGGAVGL